MFYDLATAKMLTQSIQREHLHTAETERVAQTATSGVRHNTWLRRIVNGRKVSR